MTPVVLDSVKHADLQYHADAFRTGDRAGDPVLRGQPRYRIYYRKGAQNGSAARAHQKRSNR